MRTTTNRKIKRQQPAPTSQTFSARRPVPGPDAAVSAGRAVREAHENVDPAVVLEDAEATNLHTPGRARVAHRHNGRPPLPDSGAGFTGNATTD
jgi:hypothetical protein